MPTTGGSGFDCAKAVTAAIEIASAPVTDSNGLVMKFPRCDTIMRHDDLGRRWDTILFQ